MFFKKKAKEPAKKPTPAQAAAAHAAAPSPKRMGRSSTPSIISADLVVKGTLTSTGDLQIDSRVEGDVRSAGLVIGSNAVIQGDVVADDITVRGRVLGNIHAGSVVLGASCHIRGNILYRTLAIEHGANVEGNCRTADDPLANLPKKFAAENQAPAGGLRRSS
jgi:cytoskeletal protein CcmA (bactofilin family)